MYFLLQASNLFISLREKMPMLFLLSTNCHLKLRGGHSAKMFAGHLNVSTGIFCMEWSRLPCVVSVQLILMAGMRSNWPNFKVSALYAWKEKYL
jgi:hypothetical protein